MSVLINGVCQWCGEITSGCQCDWTSVSEPVLTDKQRIRALEKEVADLKQRVSNIGVTVMNLNVRHTRY